MLKTLVILAIFCTTLVRGPPGGPPGGGNAEGGGANECAQNIARCKTCYDEGDQKKCSECLPSHALSTDNSTCTSCPQNIQNCKECSFTVVSDSDTLICSRCREGFHLTSDGSECFKCSTINEGCTACAEFANGTAICTAPCKDTNLGCENCSYNRENNKLECPSQGRQNAGPLNGPPGGGN